MSRPKEIVWLSNAGSHKPLVRALKFHGYNVEFKKTPSPEEDLKEWFYQNLSSDICALFLEGEKLSQIDAVSTALRKEKSTQWRFLPIFWVYDNFDVQLVDRVVAIGIDEMFNLGGSPAELLARLKIRIQHANEIRRIQKKMDSATRRDAASETALQQREEFLSVCAHDLRSPIGVIQSSLSTILEGSHKENLSPFVSEILTRSLRQSGNAIRLVNDLLDVMTLEQGLKPKYEFFNLDEFLKEFYEDYRTQTEEKGIKFEYENPVGSWRVLADRDRVRQLLQNLLANAIKFTDSGKSIHLAVTPFKGRRRNDPPYSMVMISLKDEGKGIPGREIEKIFDRFSQIKDYSRAGGRGLGLTVAKQISNLHAGNLWVESQEGKGSVFHVLLPHVISRTESPKNDPEKLVALVVEPVEEKRTPYFGALEKSGYETHFVKDGVEAIAMAFHLIPDIIILRHDMHKMDEDTVSTILRSSELIKSAKIFLGLESGEAEDKAKVNDKNIDKFIPLPLNSSFLEPLKKKTSIKSAA